jgi:hypothetical protein
MYTFFDRLKHHSTAKADASNSSSSSSSTSLSTAISIRTNHDMSESSVEEEGGGTSDSNHIRRDRSSSSSGIDSRENEDTTDTTVTDTTAEEGDSGGGDTSIILDRAVRVVVMVHTMKWNYQTRIIAIQKTWLSRLPYWAKVEFYATFNDRSVPLSEFNTILVDTKEDNSRGNDQFFVALKEIAEKYTQANAFLKIDDHSFVNWQGLIVLLESDPMLQPLREISSTVTSLTSDLSTTSTATSIIRSSSISDVDGDVLENSDKMMVDGTTSNNSMYINSTFRYLGNCNCVIKHDKKGNYCKDKKECAVLDNIPDFNYVCGGSGVLMNRYEMCVDSDVR